MRRARFTLAALAAFSMVPILAIGNSGGAPSGYTGSPLYRSGDTCTRCHIGTANTGPGSVRIDVPDATYAPGSIIPVRVTLDGPLQNPTANGYQIVAVEDGKTFAAPGWTLTDPVTTRMIAGHLMQTQTGKAQTSWHQYFKTPPTATGFTMWAAGNDADGRLTNINDHTYTTSRAMTAGSVPLSINGATLPQRGASVTLDLDAPGDAGKVYVLAASFGTAGIPAGRQRVIPLTLDPLMIATARGLLPMFRGYQGALDASGKATATLVIPNFAALTGVTLHHAFVVVDPAQPLGIGTISNPLPILLF